MEVRFSHNHTFPSHLDTAQRNPQNKLPKKVHKNTFLNEILGEWWSWHCVRGRTVHMYAIKQYRDIWKNQEYKGENREIKLSYSMLIHLYMWKLSGLPLGT